MGHLHSCIAFTLWAGAESYRCVLAVDRSGDGLKEPTRRQWCHDGKRFHQYLPLIDEKQMGLTSGANSGPNYQRLCIRVVIDESRPAIGASANQLLSVWWLPVLRRWIAFNPWTGFVPNLEICHDEGVVDVFPVVHACCQPSKVERFEAWMAWVEALVCLFGGPIRAWYQFTGNFSHRHCQISLDWLFDELSVPSVDCTLSVASRTVTGVTELLEPFDLPPDIWRRDAKFSHHVAVAHS